MLSALHDDHRPELQRRYHRIAACCLAPLYVMLTDGRVGVAPGLCRDRLCPTCQSLRAREAAARVLRVIDRMDSPRFVTLTLRHSDQPLATVLDRLYACLRALRTRREWRQHVRGGVGVCEVTRNPRTGQWHAHWHLVLDGSYFPHAMLRSLWHDVTGDSYIVHIRACPSRTAASRYVASYIGKPYDAEGWPPTALCEYALAMHGRRLLVTFGSAHRCGGSDDACCTKVKAADVLCSAPRLLRALQRDDAHARRLRVLLSGLSPIARAAVGLGPDRPAPDQPSLSPDQHAELARLLREVGGRALTVTSSDDPQPAPRLCQLRIWEPPETPTPP